jgi:SOS-response transcriptional repressor LexA
VQSAQRVKNGDLAVLLLDGHELLLKRVRHLDGGRIRLYSDDPLAGSGDIAAGRIRIQGKVVGQIRRYP